MVRYIPFIFVLLWSTGFVGAKFGLPYAEPFTFLMWRMLIVVLIFILLVLIFKRPKISKFDAFIQALVGLLIHGIYLGGIFAAIDANMPAGLTALFVSLNPILLAIFSSIILHKIITTREWASLLLGFLGVMIVLYGASKWEGVISLKGIIWLSVSLFSIVVGTLLQKRYAQHVDLITGSGFQYAAALIYFIILSFTIETGHVDWNVNFALTLAWLIIVLSFAAVLLLLYMIRHGEATRVASYFYLTPPFAAFWGWLFFDEQWSWLTIAGAILVVGALAMNRAKSFSTSKIKNRFSFNKYGYALQYTQLRILIEYKKMNEKKLLLNRINEKKAQLASSRKGTENWSSSGRKKSGTSQVSKLSVQSLEKEIKSLSEELRILQNKQTQT